MENTLINSRGLLKLLVLAGCCVALSASAALGPTNSWSEWRYKKLVCSFTNATLVALNGHAMPQFATNLFDSATHLYLYSAADGEVYGAGDASFQSGNKDAIFNMEVNGKVCTKGSKPYLTFTMSGEGSAVVGAVAGAGQLDAKYVQTKFIIVTNGVNVPETYYSEGKISGTVKLPLGVKDKFEDFITIRFDNIPGHIGDAGAAPQLRLDVVEIDGGRFAGHAHGTNNCFGRYEDSPDDLVASGKYKASSGQLSMDVRGLGPTAGIKGALTAKLLSAPSGSTIQVRNVSMQVNAFGQKPVWTGWGLVWETEP